MTHYGVIYGDTKTPGQVSWSIPGGFSRESVACWTYDYTTAQLHARELVSSGKAVRASVVTLNAQYETQEVLVRTRTVTARTF